MKATISMAAVLVMAALGTAGCQKAAEPPAPYYGDHRVNPWHDYYRDGWRGERYPGPPLTGGGS